MASIAIITDTDASLPNSLAAQYGIRLVPINVHFGEETFQSGVDINDNQVFERVDRDGKLPTTSAPSPGQFAQAYQDALDAGAESIICLTVSSEISATYAAALTARDTFPEHDITVIDTLNLSMGQGFMALEAARAASKGASREEVIARATELGSRTHLYAALSTVKYLAMSGRVGHLAAGMASLLSIKPILTIQNGKLDMLERVRTQNKAWERVIELTEQVLDGRPAQEMAILHVNAPEAAKQFASMIDGRLASSTEIITTELSAGLSVHSGAGLVGIT
ncbi:MAG: DegV family protein, partial [Anaerolineales bacterium]|nr:DegV family protein [Anaerolineales bacterium]